MSSSRQLLTSATLVLHCLGGRLSRLRVQIAAAGRLRGKRVVKFIKQRYAGRDVELGDRRVADPVQVLDERTQRVTVRHDEHAAARGEIWDDRVVPVRKHARHNVAQALGAW